MNSFSKMADAPESVPLTKGPQLALPVAAIVVIAIGAYVVVVMLLLIIRQILMQRGWCTETFSCCGKEGELQCCDCCVSLAESCNCCHNPSISACLDSICPARRRLDCADIIMCNCCENGCCNSQEPFCDCGKCDCTCNCQQECDNINCCCFTIGMKGSTSTIHGPPRNSWQEGYGYGQQPGWGAHPNVEGTWGPPGGPGASGTGTNIPWGGGPGSMSGTALTTSNTPYGSWGPGAMGGTGPPASGQRPGSTTPRTWGPEMSSDYQSSLPRTPRSPDGPQPRGLPPVPAPRALSPQASSQSTDRSHRAGRRLPPPLRASEST